MPMTLDPATFRDLLESPAPAEVLSAIAGCPLVVVEVTSEAGGRLLGGLQAGTVPAVILVTAPDPGWLPPGGLAAADIILAEADSAGPDARLVVPPGGLPAAVERISAVLCEHPVAGATLTLLLRSSAGLPVPAGLIAESAAYSALQGGAEFTAWRAGHAARAPEPATGRVTVTRRAGDMHIRLARPARRNAMDWRMRDALAEALAEAIAEPHARVVLSGEGPDFCAGGDLDEFGTRPDPAKAHLIRLTRSPAQLLSRVGERTTARLHGACLGAGIELPAFAARVTAAPDTRIGLPEVGLGLVPGAGGTVSMPRRIGRWRTAFLGLTGQVIDAELALAWGLVDAIDPGPARP
jgi:enoyl-CoA hydratase/carnithine racemase